VIAIVLPLGTFFIAASVALTGFVTMQQYACEMSVHVNSGGRWRPRGGGHGAFESESRKLLDQIGRNAP